MSEIDGSEDFFKEMFQEQSGDKITGKIIIALYVIAFIILLIYIGLMLGNLDFNIKQYKNCIKKPSSTDATFTCAGQGVNASDSQPYYINGEFEPVLLTDFYGVFETQ